MLICLWNGCDFAFEDMAAFQAHVITKHALQQPQQPQLSLDNQNEEGPTAKKAKIYEEEKNKIISRGGQRKIVLMAIEVWVDVLGFVRRIQLARTISLTNWHVYQMCWPRLHGDKVRAHQVQSITIGYRHEFGQSPTGLLLQNHKEVPFPECPPPDYITGFSDFQINYLDDQVFAFLSLIAPRITASNVGIGICFRMKLSHMDEKQRASVNQLLQLLKEKIATIHCVLFHSGLPNIQFLPNVDNKMERLVCLRVQESDIPILTEFLASPRADGQQRVMKLSFCQAELPVVLKLLDAIREEFRASIQPVPQPFYISCLYRPHNDIPQSEEENPQTDETLAIVPNLGNGNFAICRHPRGQHEKWAEDARKRLINIIDNSHTGISVDISAFGMPFCSRGLCI